MEGIGWQRLPLEGGVLDQPAALMEDLATISMRHRHIKSMVTAGAVGSTPGGDRRDHRDKPEGNSDSGEL